MEPKIPAMTEKALRLKEQLIQSIPDLNYPARDVLLGAHLNYVESRFAGLASAGMDPRPHEHLLEQSGNLTGCSMAELVQLYKSPLLSRAALGLAAMNSLLEVDKNWGTGNAYDFVKQAGRDRHVGIIGHFPFVDQVRKLAARCMVFELHPRDGDLPASAIPEWLPQCDAVIITGQTVLNGTLPDILECAPKAFKILLGPSVPLSPVLLDYGIDVIGGSVVDERETVKRYVAQGAAFKQLQGVRKVTLSKMRR